MKLVLHIGMGKTGTTTLQRTFHRNARQLAEHGVLYPREHDFPLKNHQALMCLAGVEPGTLSREFGELRTRPVGEVRAMADAFWADVMTEAAAAAPDTLILSFEGLMYLEPDAARQLRSRLAEVTTDISVVAYIRHPASHWVAVAQQRVKADHLVFPPGRYLNRLREHLETIEIAFDVAIAARPFDRQSLVDGDIVTDFLVNHVPGGAELRNDLEVVASNETMSGEAMCILQELRRQSFLERPGEFAPESDEVLEVLRELESVTPQSPPRLMPVFSSNLTENHRSELTWLHERYGMKFPSEVASDRTAVLSPGQRTSIDLRELLDVSSADIDATLYALITELARR